nr:hypothetical protein [Tanacetum cinerariifolium]
MPYLCYFDIHWRRKSEVTIKAALGVVFQLLPPPSQDMGDTRIVSLTINDYLTKTRDDSRPGIVKPLFEENNATTRGFQQKVEEPLYYAWEGFSELLFKCLEHKLIEHEQLQIFYQGLDVETKRMLDFRGSIPGMIPSKRLEAIKELAGHSFVWHNEEGMTGELEPWIKEINAIFVQIRDFEQDMKFVTEEVRMSQHKFDTPTEGTITSLEETLNKFIKESSKTKKKKILEEGKRDEVEAEKAGEESKAQRNVVESYVPPIPFPDALEQMPKYANYMKDLVTNKKKLEETSKVTLNERCSVVLLNKIHIKERDLLSFSIPCAISILVIDEALVDLGASISLMPYFMFVRLDLGELKHIRMYIELASRSTQYPKGIAENVIVQIDKFVLPVDFVILDMQEDSRVPIILGRPFLATAHALIDDNLLKDQLDSFLLKAAEGYQPSNDEIGSINLWDEETFDAQSELRRSLEIGAEE